MRSREATILFIPGLGNSGPEHWQSRWQAKLPSAKRVEQQSWERPDHAAWIAAIRDALAGNDLPVVVIAHSLGVIAFAEAVADAAVPPIAGAFLVAPPSEASLRAMPEIDPAFLPYPSAPLPCPSVLVGSRNDPHARLEDTQNLALDWGAKFIDAGDADHINADSGHGPWPEGLMAFAGFLSKL